MYTLNHGLTHIPGGRSLVCQIPLLMQFVSTLNRLLHRVQDESGHTCTRMYTHNDYIATMTTCYRWPIIIIIVDVGTCLSIHTHFNGLSHNGTCWGCQLMSQEQGLIVIIIIYSSTKLLWSECITWINSCTACTMIEILFDLSHARQSYC